MSLTGEQERFCTLTRGTGPFDYLMCWGREVRANKDEAQLTFDEEINLWLSLDITAPGSFPERVVSRCEARGLDPNSFVPHPAAARVPAGKGEIGGFGSCRQYV